MRTTPEKNSFVTALAVAVCLLTAGCPRSFGTGQGPRVGESTIVVPTHQVGTVAQYARLVGSRLMPVRGYGVVGGLGIAVVSTPKGMLTDKQAREANVGGEVICEVW